MEENNQMGSAGPKGGKSVFIWVAVIIVILAGVYLATQNKSGSNQGTEPDPGAVAGEHLDDTGSTPPETPTTTPAMPTPAPSNPSSVKEFTVTGDNFKFDVSEIKVKKGDTVKITFINKGGFHDWVLDEFNAKTKQFQAPGQETVEFVADKAGQFEYYCSVGKHRQMGMVGNLIVE